MNDPSIDARLAALQTRRPAAAVARPSGDLHAPTGAAADLPPPLLAPTTDHLADPVVLAGTHRVGRRRSYPAGRARIGVTVAAAAGFLALVPVMGPLTAAENDEEPQPAPDETARRETVTIPDGAVESSIDLTTTTTSPVAPTGTVVDVPATTTMTVPAAPVVSAAPTAAAGPVAPAPPPRAGVAPAAPATTATAPSAPVAPPSAPIAPAPAPVAPAPAPAEPTPTAATTTLASVATPTPTPTAAPTTAPTTAPPAPPPPPPTTAPPPPTTSPS